MLSPGSTFATFIENTLGRLCSSSDALLPSRLAASNSRAACCRSLIVATVRTLPTVMVNP
jgi:hypothetical protein